MNSISHNIRYLPHDFNTKLNAVKTYRNGNSLKFVCRKYHISKASLMRWNKKYDGTNESLYDKSHKPKTKHPNSHTDDEIKWIKDLIRRNPSITLNELWIKLVRNKNYKRHPGSLYRVVKKNKNLEIPINKIYNYLAIVTLINNQEIISINNNYYNEFLKFYNNHIHKNNIETLKNFFKNKNIKISIKNMYRMTNNKQIEIDNKNITFKENKKNA